MSYNRQGQAKMDRYLIKKNIVTDTAGQKGVLNSAVKLKTTDNLSRPQASSAVKEYKREKMPEYQPLGGETQILTVFPSKKSAKKDHKETDTD